MSCKYIYLSLFYLNYINFNFNDHFKFLTFLYKLIFASCLLLTIKIQESYSTKFNSEWRTTPLNTFALCDHMTRLTNKFLTLTAVQRCVRITLRRHSKHRSIFFNVSKRGQSLCPRMRFSCNIIEESCHRGCSIKYGLGTNMEATWKLHMYREWACIEFMSWWVCTKQEHLENSGHGMSVVA